jgi:putative ABC transport system permease protein
MRAFSHGLRMIRRRPLSALLSALCLALGIAGCTAAWTLVDAAILHPFGLSASERLVVMWETDPSRGQALIEVSHLNFLDWQREARTLESMAAFGSSHWPALAGVGSETIPLATRAVSMTFFGTLGIAPALGRDFVAADLTPGAVPPIILSHRLWRTRFGLSPALIGQSLFVDGEGHQIIGVMPRGFGYPDDPDAWISVERVLRESFAGISEDQQRAIGVLEVLGRRRVGLSNDDVRFELGQIVRRLGQRYEASTPNVPISVSPLADVLMGRLGTRLWIAFGLAAAVLLFACANVASVRNAHARERATELAARLFLGSSRRRLAADLAIEAVPLVIVALSLAAVAWWGLIALVSTAPAVAESGVALGDRPGSAVAIVTVAAIVSWILVGLLPGWIAARRDLSDIRLDAARIASRVSSVGAPLLLGQAAVAIVVIAVAAVALQTFARLSRTDIGFAMTGVTLVDTTAPDWKYPDSADKRRLTERLQRALAALPGVQQAAAVSVRPFRFGEIVDGLPVRRAEDRLIQPGDATSGSRVVVTPNYFAALGQPIVEGRVFTDFDRADNEPVAIVSRTLARALWGDERAIGKRLETFTLSEKWRARTVVGIAGDARYRGLERPSMEVYVPHSQATASLGSFVMATGLSAPSDGMIRQALRAVETDLAIERVQTTEQLVHSVLSPARLLATMTSLLAGAGVLLLALGVFGAAAVALRSAWPEIAVRQAIGARPLQAARAPLGLLGRALAVGMAIGLVVSPLALSAAAALGLSSRDGALIPLALGALGVSIVSAIAVGPPLIRAARSSPADLLRAR